MRALPRAGRRTMRSSELSNSRESPGLSCNSSRTGLGSTSRPVLSSVRVVTINAILPYHLPFRMLSELRSSIPSGSHADADGRYLTARRLCSTITSTSHYILRRGFHAGRGRSAIRSASHIRSQYRKMDLAVGRNCLCCGIAFFDLQPAGAARSGEQRSSREQRTNCRADQTHAVGWASDETLAQQVGITKKELASRAAAITRQQRAAEARLAEQQKQQISAVKREVAGVKTDVGGVKNDAASRRADLEATKAKLASAIADLCVQG